MKYVIPTLLAISGIPLLSACGGASEDDDVINTAPVYETLSSNAVSTSALVGSAIRSNGSTGALEITTVSGSLTHNTGATTVTDGTYSLTDSDGITGGELTDGSSTLTTNGSQGFTGTYDFVRVYDQTYSSGGITYNSNGVHGVGTTVSDMPTSGSASYAGEASGLVIVGSQGFDLNSGTSTVDVDFGSETVNVTLTGFTAIDQVTGLAATAPIDTITATDMTIAGNSFDGGTITSSSGGATTPVTGANTTTLGQGHFFGYEGANRRPDEVGGNLLIQGNGGIIAGTFVAD